MRRRIVAFAATAVLVGGCTTATTHEDDGLDGTELYGHTIRTWNPNGPEWSEVTFQPGGQYVRIGHTGETIQGRWWVANRDLCFMPEGSQKHTCWDYEFRFEPGVTYDHTTPIGAPAKSMLKN